MAGLGEEGGLDAAAKEAVMLRRKLRACVAEGIADAIG